MTETQTAGIGDNSGVLTEEESFLSRLEEKHVDLTTRQAELELEKRKLPREVKTDDDVGLITGWVLRARKLAAEFEETRTKVKKPYLSRGTWIDNWFGGSRDALKKDAGSIEERSNAFLRARAASERARQEAEARAARERAAEAARAAQAAADAARQAQEAREREEQSLRDAEAARQRAILAEAAQSEHEQEVAREEARRAGAAREEAMRLANIESDRAARAAEQQAEDARKLALAANRSERRAESGGLGKLQGGGGSAKVKMVWVAKINSLQQAAAALGWGRLVVTSAVLQDMIDKASRLAERPDIPGIEWVEQAEVKTVATRTRD